MLRPIVFTTAILSLLFLSAPAPALPLSAAPSSQMQAQFLPAGTLPPQGPSSNWTPEQSYNYQIGRLAAFARACGYFSMAQDLAGFMTDKEFYSRGTGSLVGADTVTGCQYVKAQGDEVLEYLRSAQ